jgi:Acyl-protein synthetase, LuxE
LNTFIKFTLKIDINLMDLSKYDHKIFTQNEKGFESLALEVFRFQYSNNLVYHDYVNALQIKVMAVQSIVQIPFLPIRFFKSHIIQTTAFDPEVIFESSGTTGSINSRHFVKDLSLYEQSFAKGFEFFYGDIKDYAIFALLPSYLERQGSSLVYMVDKLIKQTNNGHSKFYLKDDRMLDWIQLREFFLQKVENAGKKNILLGVTYALIDVAENKELKLKNTIVMETGGMKGRKTEMIRAEVHGKLKNAFGIPTIHSEYGMTELLSQAYSSGNGIFRCPPWMRVLIRDDEDPLLVSAPFEGVPRFQTVAPLGGAINIIDLANIYSCIFIATDDAGKLYNDGSFEVLGRIDNSDIRGCSLMSI